MMRTKPFLTFLLFILILVPSTYAIGATNCGARYIPYEPYAEVTFSHQAINAYGYTVTLEGEWNESMEIVRQEGSIVSGTLTMPPSWDQPGTVRNFVVFQEVPPPDRTGTAVALTRVRCPIYVRVPYPGEFLEFDIQVADINEGQLANANYLVASRGNNTVDDARVSIEVVKNGTSYVTYSERLRRIEPKQEIRETAQLTTSTLAPGVYSVRGMLTYADDEVLVEREMRVGELDVAIINHTNRLPIEDFTRLNFTVENRWNSPVEEVSIRYRISNDQQSFPYVTTETFSLRAFEEKQIRSIAETPSVLEGVAFIEYTIRFDGNERSSVLPIRFIRPGPDYNMLLLVLLGILITIMVVIATIIIRQNGRKEEKAPAKAKKR